MFHMQSTYFLKLTVRLRLYGALFVKTLYLTDLTQKVTSLCIFSCLCAYLAVSVHI